MDDYSEASRPTSSAKIDRYFHFRNSQPYGKISSNPEEPSEPYQVDSTFIRRLPKQKSRSTHFGQDPTLKTPQRPKVLKTNHRSPSSN